MGTYTKQKNEKLINANHFFFEKFFIISQNPSCICTNIFFVKSIFHENKKSPPPLIQTRKEFYPVTFYTILYILKTKKIIRSKEGKERKKQKCSIILRQKTKICVNDIKTTQTYYT